jgi:hypothetical protein
MTSARDHQVEPAGHPRPSPVPGVLPTDSYPDAPAATARAVGNTALERWHGGSPLMLGAVEDSLEHEAETGSAPTGPTAPEAVTAAPGDAVADLRALHGAGVPLTADERIAHSAGLGWDLSRVRVHSGAQAAAVTAALGVRALTVGTDVVLGLGADTEVLAHELVHVAQQGRYGQAWIQRAPAPGLLRAGDDVVVAVYGLPADANPEPRYSRTYRIRPDGTVVIGEGESTVVIPVAGLRAGDAAQRIADQLVTVQLFRGPRVAVTGPGMIAPAYANARTAMSLTVATAHANFTAYIRGVEGPPDAIARYYRWISDHRDLPDFLTTDPPDVWTQSLRPPPRPADPVAERIDLWIRFMKDRQAENAKLPPADRRRATETMLRFQDWFDTHRARSGFATADPAKVWADIDVGLLGKEIEASARQKVEAAKESAASSPEVAQAKGKKFDEFIATATKLFGYSQRGFPYVIPLTSQGKDILVTGHPALQRVLDDLGGALLRWGTTHMADVNYASVSVQQVLVDLLQGGFAQRIAEAEKVPVEHETIDRNEIIGRSAIAAFGETVATGLLAVAVVGLFVGANVITAGAATVILVGIAGYSGVRSYQARREEIENSGYEVSVPETMLDAAGDAIGVSQLIEGITGERLGTGARLGSEARSAQLGAGVGNVTTLMLGSRAYRGGQRVGQAARLSRPGLVPAGPNAQLPTEPVTQPPAPPAPNPAMGPVERAARNALPEGLRPGLDLWSAEIRESGKSPDTVLGRMKPELIESQAKKFLERYEKAAAEARGSAHGAARAQDDPLQPRLRFARRVPDSKVTLHWEGRFTKKTSSNPYGMPWPEHEIRQAVELARRTGEEIHLFGDTASGHSYPGIDGTIGNPPRPLSLKNAVESARPNLARKMAGDALIEAKQSGYSHVEVHINMPGRTVAEIKVAWDAPSPVRTDPIPGAAFEGSTVARIVVQAKDGMWTIDPPLTGKPRTGVSPVPAREDRK